MRVQIVNRTGKPWDTHVYDSDTGKELECVAEIGPMKPSDYSEVTLHVLSTQLDIMCDTAHICTTCPHCGQDILVHKKS